MKVIIWVNYNSLCGYGFEVYLWLIVVRHTVLLVYIKAHCQRFNILDRAEKI